MTAIQTTDLCKRFGKVQAVSYLNLTVNEGEIFSLLGVNGAGKTTTVRMLCGILKPDSGDALLCGKSIVRERKAVKPLLNLSPQETAVARNLTVRENLRLMAGIYGIADAEKKIAQTMDALEITEVADRRAGKLSGGYQRRLSIAMALLTAPKILFLDEPTLGLDVLARRALWKNIEALRGKVTVILTTHYMEEAAALSDRIGIMAAGTLRACDTPDALLRLSGTDNLEDAFIQLVGKEAAQ